MSGRWVPELSDVNPMLSMISRFVIEAMDGMTKQERDVFLDKMTSVYCMECYGPQPEDGICQCWNDE